MNKIQTPDVSHEEAWWQLVMVAYSQLYLARELAGTTANPWEKYLPAMRSASHEKSPTHVLKDFQKLFRGLVHLPNHPNPVINH